MSADDYDDQNVFAKILRGEIPGERVYEDDDCIAIMDVMPQATGHALVIPKAPSRNILDIDPASLQAVILVVQRLVRAVKKAFNAAGVQVVQYNEAASGQSVFHTHFHVIPRFEGVPLKPHGGNMAEPAMLAEHGEKIRSALAELQ